MNRIVALGIAFSLLACGGAASNDNAPPAIRNAVPLPVISAALFARFTSRQNSSPAMRAVAALRQQFGGHAVRHAAGPSGTPGELAGPSSGTGSTQD